jgi:hypothetical protein
VKTGKIAVAKRYLAQIFLYADDGPDGPCLKESKIIWRFKNEDARIKLIPL